MPYISANGTISSTRPRHPLAVAWDRLNAVMGGFTLIQKAILGGVILFVGNYVFNTNPLANGVIPAAARHPNEHWNYIMNDSSFVRTMTSHLGKKNKRKGQMAAMERHVQEGDLDLIMGRVDFGGPDGHDFEPFSVDVESSRGTRCSSTQSALTAYFCGAQVAENQDVGLGIYKRKPYFPGVKSFRDMILCRHKQGQQHEQGQHRRSVYRLGIGCQDKLAGYSHAFNIIAQPDGTFYWLQSFISHYSLITWMEKKNEYGKPVGKLSLNELLDRLKKVDRLMNIWKWSSQANNDYLELFGVDKEKEAMKSGKASVRSTWKPTHRLEYFYWDEACEYPEPIMQNETTGETSTNTGTSDVPMNIDNCTLAALFGQSFFDGVKEEPKEGEKKDIFSDGMEELQKGNVSQKLNVSQKVNASQKVNVSQPLLLE